MDWGVMFLFLLTALFFFFVIGQRIAFALGFASILSFYFINDTAALNMIGYAVWKSLTSFDLLAVPMFILMGEIVVSCQLSSRFYIGATHWFGRIPGGFLQTNIIACAIFAALSGSGIATAASIGSVAYPELNKRGYDKAINFGTLGAGGALGILIPPSITMLIYGSITNTSIVKLFIAGIIPGLLTALIFMIYVAVRTKINPALVPELPPKSSTKEKLEGLKFMFPFLSLMLTIILSIYLGWATPTEAAALSVVVAIIFAVINREFTFKRLLDSSIKTVNSSCMVLFIVIGAQIFSAFITKSGISRGLINWFVETNFSPVSFFVVMCIIYLILGCIMDGTAITYFTLPLVFPLVVHYGFDPVWFGVVVPILIGIGMITPPVGINLFVLNAISKGSATFQDVCRGNIPFVFLYLLVIVILYVFPQLATWLPATMS